MPVDLLRDAFSLIDKAATLHLDVMLEGPLILLWQVFLHFSICDYPPTRSSVAIPGQTTTMRRQQGRGRIMSHAKIPQCGIDKGPNDRHRRDCSQASAPPKYLIRARVASHPGFHGVRL